MVVLTRKDIITVMMNILSILAATEAAEETAEGIGALGIDPIAIGAQAITLLVLFWIVKKYALEGIVKNLDKRHINIDRGLHLTAELEKQQAELELTVEKSLQAARKDADLIIADAHMESGKIIQFAEEKASNKADEILRAAEGKIEREIAEARKNLKSEMASLITDATEAILAQKLDTDSDRQLIENYLQEAMK
jgi:F-type H+-transporting ATPase subunit b